MYSETPHGAGALGLSELQEQALCMGEPNGFFSSDPLLHQ